MNIFTLTRKLFSFNYFLKQIDDAQEALERRNQYFSRLEEDYIRLSKENKELKELVQKDYIDMMFSKVLFSKMK